MLRKGPILCAAIFAGAMVFVTPSSAQNDAAKIPAPYADLIAKSNALSPADKARAKQIFMTGFDLWKSGDIASAMFAFKQGLDIDPTNGPANYYYADCLNRQGNQVDAFEYFSRAAALGGANKEAFEAQAALSGMPPSVRIHVSANAVSDGDNAFNRKNWDEAIAFYNHAIQVNPNNEYAHKKRGLIYVQQDRQDLALADFNQAIRLRPDDSDALDQRLNVYNHLGQYAIALQDADEEVRLKPGDAHAFLNRGIVYTNLGQYARAIQDFDQAIKLVPDGAGYFYYRGLAFEKLGDYAHAVDSYTQTINRTPNNANFLIVRCRTRAEWGRQLDDAMDDCNKAIQLIPNSGSALNSRGFVYFRMKKYAAAIADYSAALVLSPKLASSLYVRGLAKLKSGDAAGGNADIAAGTAIDAKVADSYAKYGVKPD